MVRVNNWGYGMRATWRITSIIAGASLAGLIAAQPAAAATATNTLTLTPGSLSIGSLANTTLPSASVGAGTLSGAVDSGNWSDSTGSGAGWHGTIQATTFQAEGPWAQTAGTATALGSTASGSYTGSVANALITVTVSAGGTLLNTPFAWTDQEGSSTTSGSVVVCANGTACAVSNGVTVTFAAATTHPSGATYQAKVGTLPATALTLATASASGPTAVGTTIGGANLPAWENNGSTVSGAGVATYGSAVPFVTAGAGIGMGTFTLAPGVTVTWDANNTWDATAAANWVASAQYQISSGP